MRNAPNIKNRLFKGFIRGLQIKILSDGGESPVKLECNQVACSAAALLNREPSPIETYNDVDGEVVNFFKVLREKKDA